MRARALPLAATVVLGGLIYAGTSHVGPLPPLGPFLDPANGIWALAPSAEPRAVERAAIPGLSRPVQVLFDSRAVPHIFAASRTDAYRALGYVVARDRLFQMELQTRAASGRLTELLGPSLLEFDRSTRALGLPRSAAAMLAAAGPDERAALEAYAAGVNAWIDGMGPRDLPLEFRLLGQQPERWQPINSLHFFSQMGRTLAYSELEQTRLLVRARVGAAAADALFPRNSPIQEPIQPNGQHAPRFDFGPLPPPGPPDTTLALGPVVPPADGEDGLGSNNWAVAARRTAAGHALLAGDPHLDLQLPSIWYEAHLVVPDTLDVYGVTLPGVPGVILGFNRDVAWSFTNTEADVLDRYVETVDDSAHPTRYRVDGEWRPLQLDVETYRGPRGEVLAVDTLRFNHRGPLKRSGGRWLSLRWTVLAAGNVLAGFEGAAQARTTAGWLAAMSGYRAPAQNMLVADRAGSIAIRSNGFFPLRPGDGRGDELRDGGTGASDWTGFRPLPRYPQSTDPAQGFLASANQQPIDPRVDPDYLGANWYSPWRALRINQLLRADSALTPDAMRRFQTDAGSPRADLFVPAFLAAARSRGGRDSLAQAAALLGEWDRRYTKDNQRAVLFELAMDELADRLWDELGGPAGRSTPGLVPLPGAAVAAELLADSTSAWWDDRRTPDRIERRDDILAAALVAGYGEALKRYGPPAAGGWRWDRVHHANIYHLLRIPALSALDLAVDGGPSTLSPSSGDGTFGSSWRMVVELGPEVHAWGTYPGGQSGSPVSRRYTDRLSQWLEGTLDSLRFPGTPKDLSPEDVSSTLTLSPGS